MRNDFEKVIRELNVRNIGIEVVSSDFYQVPDNRGFVKSPVTADSTRSCKLYPSTNTFCDFANGRQGGDIINFIIVQRLKEKKSIPYKWNLRKKKERQLLFFDGGITMRADIWRIVDENKSLRDENKALKQHLQNMTDVCDGSCFSGDDPTGKILLKQLQSQHQQDCIRINDLTTTVHVLAGLYSTLRKNVGMD